MTDYLTWKTRRAEALAALKKDARKKYISLSEQVLTDIHKQIEDEIFAEPFTTRTITSFEKIKEPIWFDPTRSNANSICEAIDQEIMEKLLHPMISIYTGKVVWFDSKKGFGFISRENQPDIFVHFSDIAMDGYKNLIKDQTVQFQIGENYFGKPKAIKVSLFVA